MIQADNVNYLIGARPILNSVSLKCLPGQVTALLGPNGAGKSTLLKALSGEYKVKSGSIALNGKSIEVEWTIEEMACVRSVMPQSIELNFDFSVMEVVLMGRSAHNKGIESAKDLEIAEKCLAEVECINLKDRKFTTLSGGEKQRITLARVLAQIDGVENAVLLMDEPTASLDPEHKQKAMQSARDRADKGATVFVILHDFNIAARFADKIYFIHEGSITAGGTPEEVIDSEKIKESFNTETEIIKHPVSGRPQVIFL